MHAGDVAHEDSRGHAEDPEKRETEERLGLQDRSEKEASKDHQELVAQSDCKDHRVLEANLVFLVSRDQKVTLVLRDSRVIKDPPVPWDLKEKKALSAQKDHRVPEDFRACEVSLPDLLPVNFSLLGHIEHYNARMKTRDACSRGFSHCLRCA